jgi:hypothetical protein
MRVTISRKRILTPLHLYRKDWTFEKNDQILCIANYHGTIMK